MTAWWPFTGRTAELARAGRLVRAGTGLLLAGEPGIGKTALAREIMQRAAGGGLRPGFAEGRDSQQAIPFGAFAGVLADAGVSTDGPPVSPAEVARRIPAALGAAPGERVILMVDDAHLLDDSSARVLHTLAASRAATLVLAARLPAAGPLAAGVARLWRDGHCERLDVPPLTGEEVRSLLVAALGGPVDPAAAARFARQAQGNCLLLRELVTASLSSGSLRRREGAWVLAGEPPLSSGVREIVASRLAEVGPDLRGAAEVLAAGEPLPLMVAAAVVGEEVLEQAEAQRLAAVRQTLGGTEVRLAHPLYGEVIRAEMPQLRLRRLRLELARRLESAAPPVPHDLVRAALWRLEAGQDGDHARLIGAARAACGFSLATAERLARSALDASGSLAAALLLAEILAHAGRGEEAAGLVASLPPGSLTPADREAIAYCTALGRGLLSGDTGAGTQVVADVLAGEPAASDRLRALYALMLAFDARLAEALDHGMPVAQRPAAGPVAQTLAALAVTGACYWLGRMTEAVTLAGQLLPVAETVRDAVPFGPAAIELMAICAQAEVGELGQAGQRAVAMHTRALAAADGWAAPRAAYCLGRVELLRGRPRTAAGLFRQAAAGLNQFDQTFVRHLRSMSARACAATGDLAGAQAALGAPAGAPRMKVYEPEWELAEAAVLAASLRMAEAAERAAWVAGITAARGQGNVALAACHDAARYGGARQVLGQAAEAAAEMEGALAACYAAHVRALAAGDAAALDAVSLRFEDCGALQFAAEAAGEAALAHGAAGAARAGRGSARRLSALLGQCEDVALPWLAGAAGAAPLTARERQVAALAAAGSRDAEIAAQLGISLRTAQTHLTHVYSKLGIHGRAELPGALYRAGSPAV